MAQFFQEKLIAFKTFRRRKKLPVMRAAPVFLQLYNAGYRNIQIYDGAYLEWSSNPNNPVDIPSGMAAPSKKDAS